MTRLLCRVAPLFAVVAFFAAAPPRASAQEKVDHPHLRAALQELREARAELEAARDNWPPGYKDRAMASLEGAMHSIQKILAVKDVNKFRGVERGDDYYKRYKDHPRLRAALGDLREARDELRTAKADFGDLKEKAIDDIDVAIGDVLTLLRNDRR